MFELVSVVLVVLGIITNEIEVLYAAGIFAIAGAISELKNK